MDASIEQAVKSLAAQLVSDQLLIATAESCTGGMLAQYCTSLPGSSRWFDRSFICYSNEAKYEMLGVDPTTVLAHGAVSQACVEEMAIGCLQQSHADLVVAITGIAGPDGGTPDKPVGSVWLGWAGNHIPLQCRLFQFSGDRHAVRQQATLAAIEGMIACLKNRHSAA